MITLKLSNVTLSGVAFSKMLVASGTTFEIQVDGDPLTFFASNDPVLDMMPLEGGFRAVSKELGVSRIWGVNDQDAKVLEFIIETVAPTDEAVVLEGSAKSKPKG